MRDMEVIQMIGFSKYISCFPIEKYLDSKTYPSIFLLYISYHKSEKIGGVSINGALQTIFSSKIG